MRKLVVEKGMTIRGVAIAMLDKLNEGQSVEAEFNGIKLIADDKSTVERIISGYKHSVLSSKGAYRRRTDNVER